MDDQKMIELMIGLEPLLHRIAKQHLRCREDQEDAVQECLYKVWKNRKMLRQPQYFKTWAVRILKNECMTIGRKLERKADRLDENAFAVQVDMERQLEYEAMYQALEEVHYENRNIIFLHFCSGYKYKEMGIMRLPHSLSWTRGEPCCVRETAQWSYDGWPEPVCSVY